MATPILRHGSLFSGVGGFDLAAQWMGWENVFHCEWNEFGQRVLKYYWPKAISYGDITKTDFSVHRGGIDIISGGFPCQPFSVAGKRKGTEDNRSLWPQMFRAIQEIQPTFVVAENVPGLVNWDGGVVFEQVQADLEAEGYEVIPFLLPACGVNAPHRRERIWIIAFNSKCESTGRYHTGTGEGIGVEVEGNELDKTRWDKGSDDVKSSSGLTSHSNNKRRGSGFGEVQSQNEEVSKRNEDAESCNTGIAPHSNQQGLEGRNRTQESVRPELGDTKDDVTHPDSRERCEGGLHQKGCEQAERHVSTLSSWYNRGNWQNFPTQPPVRWGDDGLSSRLVGITVSKHRNESIKAYGNAIVPQVAFEIFKAISEFSSQQKPKNHEHLRKDLRAELMGRRRKQERPWQQHGKHGVIT